MTAEPNIVEKISAYISKYVKVGDDELRVIALWVLHTWAFSGNYTTPLTTPYLYIYSAERRSGKTRLLEVIETIIRNPMLAANFTTAVLFRSIESLSPTLLLDEVDAIWSGAKNEEMRGVLNAGYKRGGKSYRIVNQEPTPFNVFSPKALAGIDNSMLPDTVRDRCIPIHMHRQPVGESVPFYSYDVEDDAEALTVAIVEWMDVHFEKVANLRPAPIDGIGDRAWEISMPLIMLAQAFGKSFEKETRAAVKRLLTTEEKLSPNEQLLEDIREMFNEAEMTALPGAYIVAKLDERTKAGAWSGKLLASKLSPFGIQPTTVSLTAKQQVEMGFPRVNRGYRRQDFEAVWASHLHS